MKASSSAEPARSANVSVHSQIVQDDLNSPAAREAMSLLKLSHTPVEHNLYQVMLTETRSSNTQTGCFSVRRLMKLTGLNSYSTIRRGREGLLTKLSIDRKPLDDVSENLQAGAFYTVFSPDEIFKRRQNAGQQPIPKEFRRHADRPSFSGAIELVADRHDLSRREAQVALCCAEGMTNCEIGSSLFISEQTVKFHLRHIFVKFGVRRRGELISRLLLHEG